MRRTTRTAAGAIALAMAFGIGSPVAAAAGPTDSGKPGHVQVGKGDKGLSQKGKQQLRQVLRDIARTDARLARIEGRTDRAGEHSAAVLANIAVDRAALTELASAVQAADSTMDLRVVRKALRDVRPENYQRAVNKLSEALELAAEIAAARTALEGDAAAPVTELDAAQAAVDAAVAKALLVTASSSKDELRAINTDLEAAHAAFEVVLAYLESLVVEEEPVEEEPIEEEPVGDPVV